MSEPIRIVMVSTSRSDFGFVAPLARAAQADARFACVTVITGQHLPAGTPNADELLGLDSRRLPASDSSVGHVHQRALLALLEEHAIEAVLVIGDRHELLEVAHVATVANLALAHCSGGEKTQGAIDDVVRDAVTRLAHLHYPTHEGAGNRLVDDLKEEPRRVLATGDPGIDTLLTEPRLSAGELEQLTGAKPGVGDLCVAVHPITRDPAELETILGAIAAVAAQWPGHLFFSSPNGDPGSERIHACWSELARRLPRCHLLASLGSRAFRSLIAFCGVMIGNSSAGLIEAPSLGTPTVNLGTRQLGRKMGTSVIDCRTPTVDSLRNAITQAHALRHAGRQFDNPYGDGHAIPRILDHLAANLRSRDPAWNLLVKT